MIVEGAALSFIDSVSVNAMSTFAGFDISRVSIIGDRLLLNWNGLGYVDGTRLVLDFEISEIPLPFGWTLMAAGLALGSGASNLRRKLAAAAS